MKFRNLLRTLVILSVVLISGCKKNTYQATVGVCPIVESTIPAKEAVKVPLNQLISATFNEKMNPETITNLTFTITAGNTISSVKSTTAVDGAITFSGKSAFFTPSAPLAPNTTYTGRITTSVRDLTGNALQSDYVWTFSTDVTPTVSTDPANNAVDVQLNKIVIATFSVAMDSLTFKSPATTFTVKQGTTDVPGKFSYINNTVTFTPGSALSPLTVYTGKITTDAKNIQGTALASDYIWNFTTIPKLTLSSNPVLGGTTTGAGTFAQGSSVTVVATPAVGYTFINWTDGLTVVSTNSTYQFNMSGNKSLVANFTIIPFTVLVSSSPTAGGITSGGGIFNSGSTVAVTAVANPGFTFTNWTENGIVLATTTVYTFVIVGSRTLVANYTAIPYTVSLSSNPALGGTTGGGGTFNSGATVTLTATANSGYTFTNWTEGVNVASSIANYIFTLSGNRTLVAHFTPIISGFTLNVTSLNGVVLENPTQVIYDSGATVLLTVTPNAGYIFSSWSGDATGSGNPLTVLMNANKNITANYVLSVPVGPGMVDLGGAGNFEALSMAGISTTGVTSITGNIGVSPAAATAITGFGLIMDTNGQSSHTPIVSGSVYASDYAPPTPANLTVAVANLLTAFTTANNLVTPAPIVDLYAGDISGRILPAGLYKWGTGVLISNAGVTLTGGANDTWVFQIAQNLTVDNSAIITLLGGAQASNIFWVVSGQATLGSSVNFSGNILSKTLISVNTGSTIYGRLLAQTAVTLNASTIIMP